MDTVKSFSRSDGEYNIFNQPEEEQIKFVNKAITAMHRLLFIGNRKDIMHGVAYDIELEHSGLYMYGAIVEITTEVDKYHLQLIDSNDGKFMQFGSFMVDRNQQCSLEQFTDNIFDLQRAFDVLGDMTRKECFKVEMCISD